MRDLFCARNDMTEECVFAFMNETGQPRCGMPNGLRYAEACAQQHLPQRSYKEFASKELQCLTSIIRPGSCGFRSLTVHAVWWLTYVSLRAIVTGILSFFLVPVGRL